MTIVPSATTGVQDSKDLLAGGALLQASDLCALWNWHVELEQPWRKADYCGLGAKDIDRTWPCARLPAGHIFAWRRAEAEMTQSWPNDSGIANK